MIHISLPNLELIGIHVTIVSTDFISMTIQLGIITKMLQTGLQNIKFWLRLYHGQTSKILGLGGGYYGGGL